MDNFEKDDMLEQLDIMLSLLLEAEANHLKLSEKQAKSIFRSMHNLKGTLAMLGAPMLVIELLHECEELYKTEQARLQIEQVNFDILYKAGLQLSDYLKHGNLPQSFHTLQKCTNCKNDPENHMPQQCKEEKMTVEEMNYKLENLHLMSMLQKQADAKILYVDSSTKQTQLELYLNDHNIKFDKLDCLKELYKLGGNIRQYRLVVIHTDHASMPISLALKVVQRVNKSCHIILCGKALAKQEVDDFTDISFFWIGLRKNGLPQLLANVFSPYMPNAARSIGLSNGLKNVA